MRISLWEVDKRDGGGGGGVYQILWIINHDLFACGSSSIATDVHFFAVVQPYDIFAKWHYNIRMMLISLCVGFSFFSKVFFSSEINSDIFVVGVKFFLFSRLKFKVKDI